MKRGFVALFFLAFLVVIPTISAEDTEIMISTYSNHTLDISFLVTSPIEVIGTYRNNSGEDGQVTFTMPISVDIYSINAFVKNGNDIVVHQRFDDIESGESVHLILLEGYIEIVKNFEETEIEVEEVVETEEIEEEIIGETENTTTLVEKTDEEQTAGITGMATSEDNNSFLFSNLMYYILGAIVLSAIVFMIVSKKRTIKKEPKEIKVKKLSELKEDKVKKIDEYKDAIEEAEKKIEEAQQEIKKLKNQDKINEIKRRMVEDEKELMKLRKGED